MGCRGCILFRDVWLIYLFFYFRFEIRGSDFRVVESYKVYDCGEGFS